MHYVYLLKSEKDGSLYVGCSDDLKKRLIEHNKGQTFYTRRKLPWRLVYYEAYLSSEAAYEREKQLKRFGSAYAGLIKRLGAKIENMGA